MIALLMNLILLLPQQGGHTPLTAQTLLDAHRQSATTQALLSAIESATVLAAPSEEELKALAQAGVAPEVIQKFKDKSAASATPGASAAQNPTPAPQPALPDDARLKDIVRLVKSGLSEDVVMQQIRYSGESYKPSVNDLIFLQSNQVPESVIRELIQTHSRGLAAKDEPKSPAIVKDAVQTFQPLLYMKGFLKKNAAGSLTLKEGRIEWLDTKDPGRNYAIQMSAVKTVWLDCSPRPQGNFCFAISLGTFNGDTYSYRDLNWEAGGNTQILALSNALKTNYPQIVFQENTK